MTSTSQRARYNRYLSFADTDNSELLPNICGVLDENLRLIENTLDVQILRRGEHFKVSGDLEDNVRDAVHTLSHLQQYATQPLSPESIHLALIEIRSQDHNALLPPETSLTQPAQARGNKAIYGRTPTQRDYIDAINDNAVTFGIGPAGTGKTFLAVAAAVDHLCQEKVERIILARPAVEAGEKLGFLPGDLTQKIDPYLRPLYDALDDLMGASRVSKALEKGAIEIAPLAFMRGRTLNHAFIILDEAQNASTSQMKMFLTRFGVGAKVVVTGDLTQIDLPPSQQSGLVEAQRILSNIDDIAMIEFSANDVVRHPLVARIVHAYDQANAKRLTATTG